MMLLTAERNSGFPRRNGGGCGSRPPALLRRQRGWGSRASHRLWRPGPGDGPAPALSPLPHILWCIQRRRRAYGRSWPTPTEGERHAAQYRQPHPPSADASGRTVARHARRLEILGSSARAAPLGVDGGPRRRQLPLAVRRGPLRRESLPGRHQGHLGRRSLGKHPRPVRPLLASLLELQRRRTRLRPMRGTGALMRGR